MGVILKKGDNTHVRHVRGRETMITEDTVKSIGRKYITLENFGKFHVDTLMEVNGCGVSNKIITDLVKYEYDKKKNAQISKIDSFVRAGGLRSLEESDFAKIYDIIREY